MGNFFAELKRRHMYRVAAAYAVVAWVILQLVNNLAPALKLPDWVATAVVVLLAAGFPLALLFCWIQHMPSADGTSMQTKTAKVDWLLIGALIAVLGAVSYQQMASVPGENPAPPTASAGTQAGISIAVLPFANLSGDAAQEFFSDGMTEEITSALARVPNLQVVGRISTFQFKGQNKDLRAIRQSLSASYLIDGSVRKEGDRLRITAQLIQSDSGANIWTENYDRQLIGVFAIQEEIAQAIANALRVPLGLQQGQNLVSNRTNDVDSYQQYLRAKAMVRARGLQPLTDASVLLEQIVARDPDYPPAWALLAQAYAQIPTFHRIMYFGSSAEMREFAVSYVSKADAAARRAIELDPKLADGYLSLGLTQRVRGNLTMAEELYLKALSLDPGNPDALHVHARLLSDVGRLKEALATRQRLQAVEPFVPIFKVVTGEVLWLNGQNDAAIAMLNDVPNDPNGMAYLAEIFASMDRYGEAGDILTRLQAGPGFELAFSNAAGLLRTAPAKTAAPQSLPRLANLTFVYLHVGAADRSLETYENATDAGYSHPYLFNEMWHSSYASVRKIERFKAYLRKAGFVEYWRAKGWPEFCHPTTGDDFVCS